MKKTFLLILVLAGMALTLSGCGHWGHWGGYGDGHSHYRGCGHPDY